MLLLKSFTLLIYFIFLQKQMSMEQKIKKKIKMNYKLKKKHDNPIKKNILVFNKV